MRVQPPPTLPDNTIVVTVRANLYSARSESTGFADAALIDSRLTVNHAISNAATRVDCGEVMRAYGDVC